MHVFLGWGGGGGGRGGACICLRISACTCVYDIKISALYGDYLVKYQKQSCKLETPCLSVTH